MRRAASAAESGAVIPRSPGRTRASG
jgi:hypothetical protein